VVAVRVGVDHPGHRAVAAVLPVQLERGRRGLRRDQRVDDDDAGVALDDRHVGQVKAAHLVDAWRHLEQPLSGAQLGLPPQARVHRVRAVGVEVGVLLQVPHHPTLRVGDDARIERFDQSTLRVLEVGAVGERWTTAGHVLLPAAR
jgi:hypothetical protein